jgi:hypothetical protein
MPMKTSNVIEVMLQQLAYPIVSCGIDVEMLPHQINRRQRTSLPRCSLPLRGSQLR